jgi:8-oxo-dGTP pyrophosphatase MutT (NUDIX family)
MNPRETAGGVVLGSGGKMVVVCQGSNVWSLPKGGVEDGEDLLAAAKREVEEECGISQLEFVRELGSYLRYQTGQGGVGERTDLPIKHMNFFLFTTPQTELRGQEGETTEARWVTLDEALTMLTHPKDKEFLASVRDTIEKYASA